MSEQQKPNIKFDMIGLFVKDLKTMVHFYNKIIGIEIEWDGEGPYAEFKHESIKIYPMPSSVFSCLY